MDRRQISLLIFFVDPFLESLGFTLIRSLWITSWVNILIACHTCLKAQKRYNDVLQIVLQILLCQRLPLKHRSVNVDFFSCIPLWYLKRFYEGIFKGLHKIFLDFTKKCENKI